MQLKRRRLDKGWSQERLAEVAGISPRTVQRVEGGAPAGLETLNCLAAALDVDVSTLQEAPAVTPRPAARTASTSQTHRSERAEHRLWLRVHLAVYAATAPALALANLTVLPGGGWSGYAAGFWLLGLAIHAATLAALFGTNAIATLFDRDAD